jgi:hypothetical protein
LVKGSWTQGLIEATYALDLARNTRVELNDNHALINNQQFGALYESTSAYTPNNIKVTSPIPNPTQLFGKSAGGIALSTLLKSLKGASTTTPFAFPNAPTVDGSPGLLTR